MSPAKTLFGQQWCPNYPGNSSIQESSVSRKVQYALQRSLSTVRSSALHVTFGHPYSLALDSYLRVTIHFITRGLSQKSCLHTQMTTLYQESYIVWRNGGWPKINSTVLFPTRQQTWRIKLDCLLPTHFSSCSKAFHIRPEWWETPSQHSEETYNQT